ncbi:MAG: HD domain-containing protein, partial [Candidatus Kerfeldbacteria bacterium]|nr:HD domain-containing protein [Candidatus Kerfeldbacteria bacterium]
MAFQQLEHHPVGQAAAELLRDLPNARVFVVGGAVRDVLLGRTVKDVDLVVAGVALDELARRLRTIGSVDAVGKRFAVLKVTRPDGQQFDVALPRTDASFGTGRYRDVAVRADPNLPIEEDLERRDFTVNALAWEVGRQRLLDPFGGQADLHKRLIRAVGDPVERFQEDATRILRAVRFAVQLDFAIEPSTAAAMRPKLSLLQDQKITPPEVVAHELVGAFAANPVRAFDLWDEHGLFQALIPEIVAMKGCAQPPEFHAEGDVWTHTRLVLAVLSDPSFAQTFPGSRVTPQLAVTVLLHDIGKPPTQKTPDRDAVDRIRFDGHAEVGAKLGADIGRRLKLTSAGLDLELMAWSIEHHLDTLNLDSMKLSTIEKTYLQPPERGQLLQQLCWADGRASLDPEEKTRGATFHAPKR